MGSSQQFPRLFTVNEANDLLPELRPLVQRVSHHLEGLRAKSETVIRGERLSPDSPELMKRLQEDTAIARMILEVKGVVEEINSYGCVCKGIEEGLIDFPCLLGGEIVFLCWRYDEESVAHWHRIEDGFAGRKALLEADDDSSGNVSYH